MKGCPAKCTSCIIPNFNAASTANELQCTGCLPGFFLSQGQCVTECPSDTFVSPQDNLTCTCMSYPLSSGTLNLSDLACDSSCSSCLGSSTFCLACAGNLLASNGKCVQACPSNTFQSSGACLTCHPDCTTCSGGNFNQCSSCPSDRPVPDNGRCLPTCGQSQFFDTTTSSCQSCDSSCSSCSGTGSSNCLGCASTSSVLRSGSCTTANCVDNSTVVPGLGVCLSDLIIVPQGSQTSSLPSLPSITGINEPTTVVVRRPLTWWEILLMTLGCAFIFVVFLWLCRRKAKKRRAKRTAEFATSKGLDRKQNWRWRLIRFGEKLFGHSDNRRVLIRHPNNRESESVKLAKIRDAEEARNSSDGLLKDDDDDIVKIIGSYREHDPPLSQDDVRPLSGISSHAAPSIYSQVTGAARRGPDVRQPVKELTSRFSDSTQNSWEHRRKSPDHKSKNPFASLV